MEQPKSLVKISNYILSSTTLGEGGFSKVKVANHRILKKNVALKIIKESSIKEPYIKLHLEREAKILSGLIHKNVMSRNACKFVSVGNAG